MQARKNATPKFLEGGATTGNVTHVRQRVGSIPPLNSCTTLAQLAAV